MEKHSTKFSINVVLQAYDVIIGLLYVISATCTRLLLSEAARECALKMPCGNTKVAPSLITQKMIQINEIK